MVFFFKLGNTTVAAAACAGAALWSGGGALTATAGAGMIGQRLDGSEGRGGSTGETFKPHHNTLGETGQHKVWGQNSSNRAHSTSTVFPPLSRIGAKEG